MEEEKKELEVQEELEEQKPEEQPQEALSRNNRIG